MVRRGSGLLVVGGWASFSGPFGGWRRVVDRNPVRRVAAYLSAFAALMRRVGGLAQELRLLRELDRVPAQVTFKSN